MEIMQIKNLLNSRIKDVCRHLLPNGSVQGHEFVVGSIRGEKPTGQGSCKIHLTGEKTGVWSDFADNTGGDVLDLWVQARNISFPEAIAEIKDFLHIKDEPIQIKEKEIKPLNVTFKSPTKVREYLRGRGITDETMDAFRIGEKMHFFPQEKKEMLAMAFPSYKNGKLIRAKYIAVDRPTGGKIVAVEANRIPILFGWHLINFHSKEVKSERKRAVCIREGEINAMTLHQLGIPSLALPLGAGSGGQHAWIEYDYPELELFDTIFISMDEDEAGKAAALEIAARLGIHRCRIVRMPKDPNDLLMAGKADDIRGYFKQAEYLESQVIKKPSYYGDDVRNRFKPEEYKTGWSPLMTKMRNGQPPLVQFRYGETTIITGINSHGKSSYIDQLILDAVSQGERVCLASLEQDGGMTLARQVKKAVAQTWPKEELVDKALAYLDGKEYIYDALNTLKLEDFFRNVEYAIRRYGVSLVILDSLMCLDDVLEESIDSQRKAINAFSSFMKKNHVHGFLVAHPRKGLSKYDRVDRIAVSGSGKLTDRADNVISVWRNIKKEEFMRGLPERLDEKVSPAYEDQPDGLIIVDKQRYTGLENAFSFYFDTSTTQFLENKEAQSKIYVGYDEYGN